MHLPPVIEIADNRDRFLPELAHADGAALRAGKHLPEQADDPRLFSPAGDGADFAVPFKFNGQGIQRPFEQFAHVAGFGNQMESRTGGIFADAAYGARHTRV